MASEERLRKTTKRLRRMPVHGKGLAQTYRDAVLKKNPDNKRLDK